MAELENNRKYVFPDTLKWGAASVCINALGYFILRILKIEMRNIVVCFQASSTIFLGEYLLSKARALNKKQSPQP